jgi:hypothetical protein
MAKSRIVIVLNLSVALNVIILEVDIMSGRLIKAGRSFICKAMSSMGSL